MALSAGASRIAAIAGEMEAKLKTGRTGDASGQLPDLESAHRETLTAMENELSAVFAEGDQHSLGVEAI